MFGIEVFWGSGRCGQAQLLRPFRARTWVADSNPRALPWAGMFRSFGPLGSDHPTGRYVRDVVSYSAAQLSERDHFIVLDVLTDDR